MENKILYTGSTRLTNEGAKETKTPLSNHRNWELSIKMCADLNRNGLLF